MLILSVRYCCQISTFCGSLLRRSLHSPNFRLTFQCCVFQRFHLFTFEGRLHFVKHFGIMSVPASSIYSPGASKNPKFKNISDVEIDRHGKFKYVLLKVHDPTKKEREFKHIVRGSSKAAYHNDIYEDTAPKIEEAGLDCECVGGGRIQHDPNKRKIEIFGYSQGFGQADHRITAALISKKYPSYDNISYNNDGY